MNSLTEQDLNDWGIGGSDTSQNLTASTGRNDSSSIWGSGLLTSILGTGAQTFTSFNQTAADTNKAKANLKAAALNNANQTAAQSRVWLFAIIGIVLVVVSLVIFKRR